MDCENKDKDKDNSSIISDRCWEERYKGDSRKWILRDDLAKKTDCSSMKDSFRMPESDERIFKGRRRRILEQKLMEEVAQEIIDEKNIPDPIEEYCTEYDGNYNYPGYDPNKKRERNTELYLKYPLYTSPAVSFWKFKLDNEVREQVSIRGLTPSLDAKNPFKRNSDFSKPISEVLDKDIL